MTTYVDSSVLVAVYVPERFSNGARAAIRKARQIPFTALHQLEVPNAFEQLVGRAAMTKEECRAVNTQLREDVEQLRLVPVAVDLWEVFTQAGELSQLHAARHLARNLDLLHVAAARVLGCRTFVSADDRQLAVAKASGLATVDIKRARASARGRP